MPAEKDKIKCRSLIESCNNYQITFFKGQIINLGLKHIPFFICHLTFTEESFPNCLERLRTSLVHLWLVAIYFYISSLRTIYSLKSCEKTDDAYTNCMPCLDASWLEIIYLFFFSCNLCYLIQCLKCNIIQHICMNLKWC